MLRMLRGVVALLLSVVVLQMVVLPGTAGAAPAGATISPIEFTKRDGVEPDLVVDGIAFFRGPIGAVEGHYTLTGMLPGMRYGAVVSRDGKIVDDNRSGFTWTSKHTPERLWTYEPEDGLKPGVYEVTFYVEGKKLRSGTFVVV
jgi:hypothetical protein